MDTIATGFLVATKSVAILTAWWRDACLSYFQTFSGKPIPDGVEKPEHALEYYEQLSFPFAPGIRPRW